MGRRRSQAAARAAPRRASIPRRRRSARSRCSRSRWSRCSSATASCACPSSAASSPSCESLSIGFKALGISANAQLPEDEKEISGGTWAGTVALAMALAIGLFFLLPVGLTSLFRDALPNSIVFVIVEKLIRIAIFLGYLVLLSRLKDLRRVFEYHGAEHKTISCYEAGPRADAGERPALLAAAPALRHELPAHRHDRRDLRLRAARHARVVLAVPLAHRRHPARRRPGLRGHQGVRAQPPQALGAGAHVARDAAAEAHDARARPRPARRGDRRHGGRPRPSRRPASRPPRTWSGSRSSRDRVARRADRVALRRARAPDQSIPR